MSWRPFEASDSERWDAFCAASANGCFLHSRRFLSYHGDRFKDASALLEIGGEILAVFPAAADPSDPVRVVSHPGSTYGGIVHAGGLNGQRMLDALSALGPYYKALGFQRLAYKAVPFQHSRQPAQDDLYALWRLGARLERSELSAAVDLERRRAPSERRKRGLKKAQKAVSLSGDLAHLPVVWELIAANLAREHSAKPVHSLAELRELFTRFPAELSLRAALMGGKVEAGVILFNPGPSWHAQYIAASETAYDASALDAVFEAAFADAKAAGARYFDFGTSNEEQGRKLNDGLYRYKTEFGGGGIAHLSFEWDL